MKTVLVVDDETLVADALAAALGRAGYAVLTATDGAEALALLARTSVDVVLCDVVMAGVDGASLLRALRESPATERLPVILMSMLSEDRVWALCTGYAKYLRKPLAMDALHAAIADVTAPAAHGFTLNDALRTGPAH